VGCGGFHYEKKSHQNQLTTKFRYRYKKRKKEADMESKGEKFPF